MNLFEFQSKDLLSKAGVPVPKRYGILDGITSNWESVFSDFGPFVLKAQVHSGGRGKAGGIKIAHSVKEAKDLAKKMLETKLQTDQARGQGLSIRKILVEEAISIQKEIYFSITLNRLDSSFSVIVSPEGGIDIETLSHEHPEKVYKFRLDVRTGLLDHQIRYLLRFIGISIEPIDTYKNMMDIFQKISQLFLSIDASLIEINPIVLTHKHKVICLDAKITIDDNACFRQKFLQDINKSELNTESVLERRALDHQVSYVELTGDIGCMVNGAGLAMCTMDIIQKYGGSPANFLDVGGSSTTEQIRESFHIIVSNPKVKVVWVNIFGGIMQCDRIAHGIVAAIRSISCSLPVVIRLEGSSVEQGRKILSDSKMSFYVVDGLLNAAKKAVQLSKGSRK